MKAFLNYFEINFHNSCDSNPSSMSILSLSNDIYYQRNKCVRCKAVVFESSNFIKTLLYVKLKIDASNALISVISII